MGSLRRTLARQVYGIHDVRARERREAKIEQRIEFIKECEKRKRLAHIVCGDCGEEVKDGFHECKGKKEEAKP